jgi:hypothetical protein
VSAFSWAYIQYVDSVSSRILAYEPAALRVITFSPPGGTILPGETGTIMIMGDASGLQSGANSATNQTTLNIENNGTPATQTVDVSFTATNSLQTVFAAAAAVDDSDGDGMADDQERIAGTDPQNVASVFTPDVENTAEGAVLVWEAPLDGLPRTYRVYRTENLNSQWKFLAVITNAASYLDAEHPDAPAAFYKVTVE